MEKRSYFILLFCLLFFSAIAFTDIKTITTNVKQPFVGNQSPDDARIAAIAKAKREALEIGQKSLGKNHPDTKHYKRKVDSIEALDPFGGHKWSSPKP